MPRVVHFEFPADNPERAAKFYQDVFGWKIDKWEGPVDYWLITTGTDEQPGINGALMRRPADDTGIRNVVEVGSVDESMQAVKESGGQVVMPKMAVPGVGWVAYCSDTEGNVFGMMQPDPSAV